MRKKNFFVVAAVILVIALGLAYAWSLAFTHREKKMAVEDVVSETEAEQMEVEDVVITETEMAAIEAHLEEVQEQCLIELSFQSSGISLFYCEDLQNPVCRTASEWELIFGVCMQSYTEKTTGTLELIPCSAEVGDFYYLPINDDAMRNDTPPSDDAGWIKVSQNEKGNFILPLDKIGEYNNIAIKYSSTDWLYELEDLVFYGIITVEK